MTRERHFQILYQTTILMMKTTNRFHFQSYLCNGMIVRVQVLTRVPFFWMALLIMVFGSFTYRWKHGSMISWEINQRFRCFPKITIGLSYKNLERVILHGLGQYWSLCILYVSLKANQKHQGNHYGITYRKFSGIWNCWCNWVFKFSFFMSSSWPSFSFCSLYDVRPSENDLIDHMNFIREAVKRDETLGNSKVCIVYYLWYSFRYWTFIWMITCLGQFLFVMLCLVLELYCLLYFFSNRGFLSLNITDWNSFWLHFWTIP